MARDMPTNPLETQDVDDTSLTSTYRQPQPRKPGRGGPPDCATRDDPHRTMQRDGQHVPDPQFRVRLAGGLTIDAGSNPAPRGPAQSVRARMTRAHHSHLSSRCQSLSSMPAIGHLRCRNAARAANGPPDAFIGDAAASGRAAGAAVAASASPVPAVPAGPAASPRPAKFGSQAGAAPPAACPA